MTGGLFQFRRSATTRERRHCWEACHKLIGSWHTKTIMSDWLQKALQDKGIKYFILGRNSRRKTVNYDKHRYKKRDPIRQNRHVITTIKKNS